MMKKTLLSIITMAIVTSSTAYAAHSVQKDIVIEVEIAESLILTKADGSPLNSLKLDYKPDRWTATSSEGGMMVYDPELTVIQPVKITTSQGAKVKVSLAEEFYMSDIKGENELLYPDVYIGGQQLSFEENTELALDNKATTTLEISAEPEDVKPGDKYTGVLKLVMESAP
ncbi:CS1 type fimbrial major subunit [Yersinia mollaretii]|uniref:CS1 type fimbrial major subunit n=1 Tax=Yersinia mollaretii TaxID=33060 RepID=UPI0011A750D0|nr:CS1 type fimbrial major subunit [Yersinia mollaretii]